MPGRQVNWKPNAKKLQGSEIRGAGSVRSGTALMAGEQEDNNDFWSGFSNRLLHKTAVVVSNQTQNKSRYTRKLVYKRFIKNI